MDILKSLHNIIEELDEQGIELSDVFVDPRKIFGQINLTTDIDSD